METQNKNKILLVDDEVSITNALVRCLRKEGYTIFTATSGKEGLDIVKRENGGLSLIISDHRMPEMTGIEFLEQVKTLYPDIIRVILSGYVETDIVMSAINTGEIYKFIAKPWNDEEIKITIKHAIEQFHLKNENKRLTEELKKYSSSLEKKVESCEESITQCSSSLMFALEIIENMPMSIIVANEKGIVSFVNRYAKEVLNFYVGKKLKDILQDDMIERFKASLSSWSCNILRDCTINGQRFNKAGFLPLSLESGRYILILLDNI